MVTGTALLRLVFPGAGDADGEGAGAGAGFRGYNLGQSVHKNPDVLIVYTSIDYHLHLNWKVAYSPSGDEVVRINRTNVSRHCSVPPCNGLRGTVWACRKCGVAPNVFNGSATWELYVDE